MDMTRDAIQLIQQTAQQAVGATLVKIPGDGRTAHLWANNELKPIAIEPEPRAHTLLCLDDLIEAAKAAYEPSEASVSLWHCTKQVQMLYDDDDRRDRATFPLSHGEQFQLLSKLDQSETPMRQKEFLRTLRRLGVEKPIVNLFRKLDWETGAKARGDVTHGTERLGREVTAQVTGIEALPEDLTISIPVYRERGEQEPVAIRCDIEIDASQQVLAICPQAGEIDRAVDLAQWSIRKRLEDALADTSIAIHYGNP